MSKLQDSEWEKLRSFVPPEEGKDSVRRRIWKSIRSDSNTPVRKNRFQWLLPFAASLFILIGGTLLLLNLNGNTVGENREEPIIQVESLPLSSDQFGWGLDNVYVEEENDRLAIYEVGEKVPVGGINEVNESEKQEIIQTHSMFVDNELENFPYKTEIYIEHVKMEDTALRYHFFIPSNGKWYHFSIDYPKLEYADIFYLIATLKIKGTEPYIHDEPLYVTHGYDSFPFPVDLMPVTVDYDDEVYVWRNPSAEKFALYLEKIEESGWRRVPGAGKENTFEDHTGIQTITVRWEDDRLIYHSVYENQDE